MRAAAGLCAIAVVASGALAVAKPLRVIVDFNTLVANDAGQYSVGAVYEEDGMRFTATYLPEGDCCPGFSYQGSQNLDWIGSPTLFHHWGNGTIVLEGVYGQRFDLLSIDIAEVPSHNGISPLSTLDRSP